MLKKITAGKAIDLAFGWLGGTAVAAKMLRLLDNPYDPLFIRIGVRFASFGVGCLLEIAMMGVSKDIREMIDDFLSTRYSGGEV